MDSIIYTPRLKLTLMQKAERGSPELGWLHEVRSNEQATWWSITPKSKTMEDTEKVIKRFLPNEVGEEKTYRAVYAVHEIANTSSDDTGGEQEQVVDLQHRSTRFVGTVNFISITGNGLPLPEHLSPKTEPASSTLVIEVSYVFLPVSWGKGYATESVNAAFEACRRARSFWSPFTKVYVRSIVNDENPPSQRVMTKTGMQKKGIFEWKGDPIWLAGKWQTENSLVIYGMYLFR